MSKQQTLSTEAFQESLQALADWLAFLDEKERELKAQLDRARAGTKAEGGGGDKKGGEGWMDWLDEEPPRPTASAGGGPVSEPAPASAGAPSPPPAPEPEPATGGETHQDEPDDGLDIPDWLTD